MTLDEIKAQKIWFLWNYAPGKNGKKTKVPMSASGGVTGTSDNFRNTWTDYDTAIRSKENLSAAGIGFKVPDNMYFLDIDGRPLDDSFVQLLLERHDTYAETSSSGNGIHILGKCDNDRLPFFRDECSDNYVYKCFRFLGIKSETKHQIHYRKRKEKDKYPNLIFTTWETVDRPRQVIVSDMTAFKFWLLYFEVTFYFDVFTKEILTYRVAMRKGDRNQYIDGLEDVKKLLKGQSESVVLHTDQGSVYASMAYNEIIKDTVIVRSMSRAGKPTDNPVNESLNGWMKEELYMDFKINECRNRDEFITALDKYVDFYNKHRPCYALGYDTPVNFRKRFFKGELERKKHF